MNNVNGSERMSAPRKTPNKGHMNINALTLVAGNSLINQIHKIIVNPVPTIPLKPTPVITFESIVIGRDSLKKKANKANGMTANS